jgi:hypothetical protein
MKSANSLHVMYTSFATTQEVSKWRGRPRNFLGTPREVPHGNLEGSSGWETSEPFIQHDPGELRGLYRVDSYQTRADLEQIFENSGGFCVPYSV